MAALVWALLLLPCCEALVVIEHASHQRHRPPPGTPHAEVPARLEAAKAALKGSSFASSLRWRTTAEVDRSIAEVALERVHSPELIASIKQLSARGGGIDSDTYVAPGSWDVCLDAAGAWLEATSLAADGCGPALALARPPGHHATRAAAMGFCLANFAGTHTHLLAHLARVLPILLPRTL